MDVASALEIGEKLEDGIRRIGNRRYLANDNESLVKVIEAYYNLVRNRVEALEKEGRISSQAMSLWITRLDRSMLKINNAKKHISDPNRDTRAIQSMFEKVTPFVKAGDTHKDMENAKVEIDHVKEDLENENLWTNVEAPPHFDSPCVPSYAHFDENDHKSRFGRLRELLCNSDSTCRANVSMYCACGPGGMGKTFTLRKLCCDMQLRDHFKGGVHYVELGQDALDNEILSRLRACYSDLCTSNGQDVPSDLMSMDINLTLKKLGQTLRGRTVLFVLDDVWEQHRRYVRNIKDMLNEGKHCAVLLSSRREELAKDSDGTILFHYLEPPTGELSRRILLSQSKEILGEENYKDLLGSAELVRGLRECDGWIICLIIAGAHLKQLVSGHGNNLSAAVHEWNKDFQTGTLDLTDGCCANYDVTLSKLVRNSLSYCQEKWMIDFESTGESDLVRQCFTSLCVMQKKKSLPSTALSHVWGINAEKTKILAKMLRDASLGSMEMTHEGSFNWQMHDKLIDVSQALSQTLGGCAAYHQRLLQGYLPESSYIHSDPLGECRPWWNGLQIEDTYMFENLGYHLAQGNLFEELRCLLTDVRWWLRWREGNRPWGGISEDFKRCIESMSWTPLQSMQGMSLVHEALYQCWFGFSMNKHCLGFEMYSRLAGQNFPSVERALTGIAQWGPSPWLQPSKSFVEERIKWQKSMFKVPSFHSNDYAFSSHFRYAISGRITGYENNKDYEVSIFDTEQQSMRRCTLPDKRKCVSVNDDGDRILTMDVMDKLHLSIVRHDSTITDMTLALDTDEGNDATAISNPDGINHISYTGERSNVSDCDGSSSDSDCDESSSGCSCCERTNDYDLRYFQGCAAFTADGRWVVSGGPDGTVSVWDTEARGKIRELFKFEGHEGWVTCVAFSEDGKHCISGGGDGTVQVWGTEDVSGCREALKFEGHEGWVKCVSFSRDGKLVVSGGSDGTVRVWDTEGGSGDRELFKFEGHEGQVDCVAFSGDGKRIVSGGTDWTVRMWGTEDGIGGRELFKFEVLTKRVPLSCIRHEKIFYSVAFSRDGKLVVSGGQDGTMRVWDTEERMGGWEPLKSVVHAWGVSCVAFNRDGKLIISGGYDSTVQLWDMEGGSGGRKALKLEEHEGWVTCVAFSGDGKLVVSGGSDGTVQVWDTESGSGDRELFKFEGHDGRVICVAFSGDGKHVVSGGIDGTVQVWDTEGGSGDRELFKFEGHDGGVKCVSFSRDGKHVVSGGIDGPVRVWDTEGGSGDRELFKFEGHEGQVDCVSFSGDGKRVVAGGSDGTIQVWDTEGGGGIVSEPFSLAHAECDHFEDDFEKWVSTVFEFLGIDDGHEAELARCDLHSVIKKTMENVLVHGVFQSAVSGAKLIVTESQVRARTENGLVVLADIRHFPVGTRFHFSAESKKIVVDSSGNLILCRVVERRYEDEMKDATVDNEDGGGLVVLAYALGGGILMHAFGGVVLSICAIYLILYFSWQRLTWFTVDPKISAG